MHTKYHFLWASVLCTLISSCAGFKTGKDRIVPDMRVQLEVNSLHAKNVQEAGMLGVPDGDELTLVYTINAYNAQGHLVAVNNGLWGTRTILRDAVIAASEFDKISVHIPKDGKVIAAFALLEIDDYHGERKMAKVKPYTNSERYPKMLILRTFDSDRNLSPLDLIAKSLDVAGYGKFVTKQVNISINDELGGTMKTFDAADLTKIASGAQSGKGNYEMDGKQVNESFLYQLKYDVDVKRVSTAMK